MAATAINSGSEITPNRDQIYVVSHDDAIAFARPEYGALGDEFRFLASQFNVSVDARLARDIRKLASAIERIDRRVDEVTDDASERRARWRDVLDVLADIPAPPRSIAPRELVRAAEDLRTLATDRDARTLTRIRRIVRAESITSEAIRSSTTHDAFIRAVEREGRLTAALVLVLCGSVSNAPFRRFFFRLAAPANLVDKLLDAKEDRACGELAIDPDVFFYASLLRALGRRSIMLLLTARRPRLILSLGLRYLGPSRVR